MSDSRLCSVVEGLLVVPGFSALNNHPETILFKSMHGQLLKHTGASSYIFG